MKFRNSSERVPYAAGKKYIAVNKSLHKYVSYDHPGECSPEKDCL